MLPFAQFDEDLVQAFVDEYAAVSANPGPFAITCLDQSKDFPDERMVFVLSQEDAPAVVLKLDLAPNPTRLTKEFKILERLHPVFSKTQRTGVIQPIYLSPGGQFHVTQYTEGKTAKHKVYAKPEMPGAGQIYRRGGEWLHQLHATQMPGTAEIHLNWMFDEIEKRRLAATPYADHREIEQFIKQLQSDLSHFHRRQAQQAFSHGDFHGGNLLLPKGTSYGLDFTEAAIKLSIYDMVDFLKMDIFAPAENARIGPDGLRTEVKDLFFKGYRHPFDHDLLNFCMRGRLLIDWVKISPEIHERSAFQRKKFICLRTRLTQAFAQPLTM